MNHGLKFIADPGHAWLQVPHRELIASGVSERISSYSYIDRQYAYLEEDCDAFLFLNAIGASASDIDEEHQSTTFIRELPPYTPAGLCESPADAPAEALNGAPYFQPSQRYCEARNIPSFLVWRSKAHCASNNYSCANI